VTLAFCFPKAEHLQPPGQIFPGVVGDDDERRPPVLVGHRDGLRFIGREKAGRRIVHLSSLIRQGID
jgi:hypothetical protein